MTGYVGHPELSPSPSGYGPAAARLSPAISPRALHRLNPALRRRVVLPSDPLYAEARRVYNAAIDKYPAVIIRCADATDVAESIRFARECGLPIAVRASGHNAAGHGICDDGAVIDVAALKGAEVDRHSKTVCVGAGVTWAEFDRVTQAVGLATPGGTVSSTGVAGLTLGGGIGWLMGPCGLTCDNLIAADLITADGDRVPVDQRSNEDLLWGLRGGGGNFGVVTAFTFRLHEIRTVVAGTLVVPLHRAGAALGALRDLSGEIPDGLTVCPTFVTDGSGEQHLSVDLCYAGAPRDGARWVSRLVRHLEPTGNTVRPQPYLGWQTYLDATFDTPMRGHWKTCFLDELSDDLIEIIVRAYRAAPSQFTTLIIEHFHGPMTMIGPDESAYGNRHKPYSLLITARWESPGQDAANVAWADELYAATRISSDGSGYLNYMGVEEEAIVRRSYGAENYRRLVALKDQYDPANVFRNNQNVRPSLAAPGTSAPTDTQDTHSSRLEPAR